MKPIAQDHDFVADAEYADRCGVCFEKRGDHERIDSALGVSASRSEGSKARDNERGEDHAEREKPEPVAREGRALGSRAVAVESGTPQSDSLSAPFHKAPKS